MQTSANSSPWSNPSASLTYPQGIHGTPVFFEIGPASSYTVPAGKTLYLTTCGFGEFGNSLFLSGDGDIYGTDGGCPMFPSGTILGGPATRCSPMLPAEELGYTGILIKNDPSITPVFFLLDNVDNEYTVPPRKVLIIRSGCGQFWSLTVNGKPYMNGMGSGGPWVFPAGVTMKSLAPLDWVPPPCSCGYTGYLVDERTFRRFED